MSKGTRIIPILQTNSSKIVDENGEPKVVYHQTNASVYINRETGRNWTAEFGAESVNLLYSSSIKEVKQRISQVSTGPNSPLNATSSASDNKDTISSPNMQ